MDLQDIRKANCSACPNYASSKHVCVMREDLPDDEEDILMVVSDYPAEEDSNNNTVFTSYKESYFWHVFSNGIENSRRAQVYPTYALKCRPDGNEVKPNDLNECSNYLISEIRRIKPKAILLMGSTPMKTFGLTGTVSKHRGKVIERTLGTGEDAISLNIIVTYEPYVVRKAPGLVTGFAKDIDRAWRIATGEEVKARLTPTVICDTLAKVDEVIEYIQQTGECAFDFETTKIDEDKGTFAEDFRATLLTFSFQHGSSYAIPLFHFETPFTEIQIRAVFAKCSEKVFANPKIRKIAHNIKYDMHVAAHYGFGTFRGRLDDTMLMHHLLTTQERHKLKEAIIPYFPEYEGYENFIEKWEWHLVPLEYLAPYGGTDTDLTFRLATILERKLVQDERLYRVYRNECMFAIKPLLWAERVGMPMNRDVVESNIERCKELLDQQELKLLSNATVKRFEIKEAHRKSGLEIAKLEEELKTAKTVRAATIRKSIEELRTGKKSIYKGFNVASPQQIAALLYSNNGFRFRRPYDKQKRGPGSSTNADYIKKLPDSTGFIKDLLIYRTIAKNMSTSMEGFLRALDLNDRIHTSFLQIGTTSGRLASKEPNIQNLPKHIKIDDPSVEEVVGMVMSSFNCPKGYAMLQLDFSQAELRIIAEMAGEENMLKAYNDGLDLHVLTAAKINSMTVEQFMKLPKKQFDDLRFKAKAANFGLIYGQSAKGYQEYAEDKYGVVMSLEEADEQRTLFFKAYPKLEDYHKTIVFKARKYGHVRTLFGRKGYAYDINHEDEYKRGEAERTIINMPVQGTCGEMTIFAFSLLYRRLPESVKFVNTVHDSILYLVPLHLVPYVASIAKYTAENLPTERYFGKKLERISLVADVEVSTTNWKETAKYKEEDWKEFRLSKIDSFDAFIDKKKQEKILV